jgi:hypothetical protein
MNDDQSHPKFSYGRGDEIKLVTVARAGSDFEAGLIRNMLESEGIRTFSPNFLSGTVHPILSVDGFLVQVEQSNVDQALELLKNTPVLRKRQPSQHHCSACGSSRTIHQRSWLVQVVVLLVMLGMLLWMLNVKWGITISLASLFLLLFQGKVICRQCKRPWDESAEASDD